MLGSYLLYQSLGGGPAPVSGGVGGLGSYLLFSQGGGKGTSSTPCGGLGSFLLYSQGGGYSGSGLSPAQASLAPTTKITIGLTL